MMFINYLVLVDVASLPLLRHLALWLGKFRTQFMLSLPGAQVIPFVFNSHLTTNSHLYLGLHS
jgi:hypothetical protein